MSRNLLASDSSPNLWTIVLAAGEGTRLRRLTRALHGEELPKQFATILGNESLLQATLRRTSCWSRPEETVIVVAEEREQLARNQVEPLGSFDIVALRGRAEPVPPSGIPQGRSNRHAIAV